LIRLTLKNSSMKSFKILHVYPETAQVPPSETAWGLEWEVEYSLSSGVPSMLGKTEFDLIVDSGATDLLKSLAEGKERESNRFLEGISSSAKFLVDLSGVARENDSVFLNLDIWDQLGKQLAWRFCALDRPIWVRFADRELNKYEAILEESLHHWTGPGLFVIRADDLNSAARIVLKR